MSAHTPTAMVRLGGIHQHYSNRNHSDAFRCPSCAHQERRNLNFLGGRLLICDGAKRKRVERWEWEQQQEMAG